MPVTFENKADAPACEVETGPPQTLPLAPHPFCTITFKATEDPEQMVSVGGITLKLNNVGTFTETVTVSETEHPSAEVTITV